uniref:Decapping nuclease n=1 Tax=Caenorhabditis tropicalis TaxID=1561998 RepID=A0A1I7V1Z5_9PELO
MEPVVAFAAETLGDYWTSCDNRWSIELGRHRYKRLIFNEAAIGSGLDEGYYQFENDHGSERLEGLLVYIQKTAKFATPLKESIKADFVCRRGLLRNFSINYDSAGTIVFYAVRQKGVIFLCEEKQFVESSDKLRRSLYYALKFKQLMTVPLSRNATATKSSETKRVFRASLTKEGEEPIRVYYAAEIDCVDGRDLPCELKLISKPLETAWDRNRTMAWYMHCFLANVKSILVAERHRTLLRQIQPITPEMIYKHAVSPWSHFNCIEQMYNVLFSVKNQMTKDGQTLKFTLTKGVASSEASDFGDYIVPEHFLRHFPF